jgi:hypothetical protein
MTKIQALTERLRTRRAARVAAGDPVAIRIQAAFDHLHDPDLLHRLATPPPTLDGSDGATDKNLSVEKRTRKRRPSLTRYFKQARKAGETGPVRVSIADPSGCTVTVVSGDGNQHQQPESNPWDEVLKRATH